VLLALVALDLYEYVGFLMNPDGIAAGLIDVMVRGLTLMVFLGVEEVLLRELWVEEYAKSRVRADAKPVAIEVWLMVQSMCFLVIKFFQFHLSWTQTLTLFLANLWLFSIQLQGATPTRSLGYQLGFVWMPHVILGLPILGLDAYGLWFLQYQVRWDAETDAIRLLTGGAGGLLASWGLIAVLGYLVFASLRPRRTSSF
jgi:hypothetical protein